jgi:hypothetical protein
MRGGAWLRGEAKDYAFPAELFVNAGVNFVAPDFISVDKAQGDLRVMAQQVRNAIAWTYKNAASFGGDPNRFYIGGHSSGGHLCGLALVTDWQKDFGLPSDFVKGGLCMSGMFDMKPARLSKRSSYVKFTDEIEQVMSAQRQIDKLRAPIILTYGTLRDAGIPTSEPGFRRCGESSRKTGRFDRSVKPQPLRNVRDAGKSVWRERARSAEVDEARLSRSPQPSSVSVPTISMPKPPRPT